MINIFKRDYVKYEGVPRVNIYLLRFLYTLMFVFVSYDSWAHIISHTGMWAVTDAAAWCMWAAFSLISFIGIMKPLKMLPIILFEIIYKVTWLIIVAYPLCVNNKLAGSPAEYTTNVFLLVIMPITFMPWRYFFRTYILPSNMNNGAA
jgi:hypothetical protein